MPNLSFGYLGWGSHMSTPTDWNTESNQWLEPFQHALGHKACRETAPSYIRGLIGPGDRFLVLQQHLPGLGRKSIRPLSDRITPGEHQRIHHFVCASTWDTTPLETLIAKEAQRLVKYILFKFCSYHTSKKRPKPEGAGPRARQRMPQNGSGRCLTGLGRLEHSDQPTPREKALNVRAVLGSR
jgi:hypothetical protein